MHPLSRLLLSTILVWPMFLSAQYPVNAYRLNGAGVYVENVLYAPNGDLICAGNFSGNVDFDLGPGTAISTGEMYQTGFVARYTPDHSLLWMSAIGSVFVSVHDIAMDSQGNIVLVGNFKSGNDFDPGPDQYLLDAPGLGRDGYVVKLDGSGALVWAHDIGGDGDLDDWAETVVIDEADDIYVGGMIGASCDVDFGPDTVLFNSNGRDAYLLKCDPDGALLWARHFGETDGQDNFYAAELTPSGHVVTLLNFADSIDADPGPDTLQFMPESGWCLMLEIDPEGDLVRAWQPQPYVGALAVAPSGDIYITGVASGTVDMDPGPGIDSVAATSAGDAYVARLDGEGDLDWARTFGPTYSQPGTYDIKVTGAGSVMLSGAYYIYDVDLDPGPGTFIAPYVDDLEAYLSVFDTSGTFVGGFAAYGPGYTLLNRIAISPTGGFAACGYFLGDIFFEPACDPPSMQPLGSADGYWIEDTQISLSIPSLSRQGAFHVWPQPAERWINMGDLPGDASQARLMDATGRMVASWSLNSTSDRMMLDLGERPNGIYALHVLTDHGGLSVPLVIAK